MCQHWGRQEEYVPTLMYSTYTILISNIASWTSNVGREFRGVTYLSHWRCFRTGPPSLSALQILEALESLPTFDWSHFLTLCFAKVWTLKNLRRPVNITSVRTKIGAYEVHISMMFIQATYREQLVALAIGHKAPRSKVSGTYVRTRYLSKICESQWLS